jgi:hypothetical protein
MLLVSVLTVYTLPTIHIRIGIFGPINERKERVTFCPLKMEITLLKILE